MNKLNVDDLLTLGKRVSTWERIVTTDGEIGDLFRGFIDEVEIDVFHSSNGVDKYSISGLYNHLYHAVSPPQEKILLGSYDSDENKERIKEFHKSIEIKDKLLRETLFELNSKCRFSDRERIAINRAKSLLNGS